jgi:DNA transformation protein
MGIKGDKHTNDAQKSADYLTKGLEGLDGISSKKMFGGHGFFHDSRMFAMVSSKGEIFFKTNETNKSDYIDRNAEKHSKMPYYSVPEEILKEDKELAQWAEKSILASKK